MKKIIFYFLMFSFSSVISAQTILEKDVVSNGATESASSETKIQATIGQSIIGTTDNNNNNSLVQGFWSLKFQRTTAVQHISNNTEFEFNISDLYPNPNSGQFGFTIKNKNTSKVKISISNSMGQLLMTPIYREILAGVNNIELDISFLPNSNYYLSIEFENKIITKSIQLMR